MDTVELTYRELQRMHNALTLLGNRRMATVGADMKVGRFLKAFQPHIELLTAGRRRLMLDLFGAKVVEEMQPFEQQRFSLRAAAAESDFLDGKTSVELPMAYVLKEVDLPKEQTGAEGWKNAEGLGALCADLGSLYVWDEAK